MKKTKEEQRETEQNHLAQQFLWLLNNKYFCYDGELPTNNDNKKTLLIQMDQRA